VSHQTGISLDYCYGRHFKSKEVSDSWIDLARKLLEAPLEYKSQWFRDEPPKIPDKIH
jgi:hypothetical protein